MTHKCLVLHDPIGVAEEFEGICAHAGPREYEVRIHRGPRFHEPAEIHARVFGVEKPIGDKASLLGFGNGIWRTQFVHDVSQRRLPLRNEGHRIGSQGSIDRQARDVTAGQGHRQYRGKKEGEGNSPA